MKKIIISFGLLSAMALCCASCGNSKKADADADSTTQSVESTETVASVEEQPAIDPNAPLTAEDEEEVLRILKEIHIAQHSADMDATPYFSKQLIRKIKESPSKHNGMGLGVCFYGGGGTEIPKIIPESIKIISFDPTTGITKYKLDVKIIDEIDDSSFMLHPKETATFIREDGKIVLDKTTAESLQS